MRNSLTLRVLLVLSLTATVPAIAVGALAIWRTQADVETEVLRGHLTHVRALGSSLNETLQGARRSLELAGAWWADERAIDDTSTPGSRRALNRVWRRLQREAPSFISLSVVDLDGHTVFGESIPADPDLGAHSFGGFVGDVQLGDNGPFVPIVTQARSRTGERIGVFVARLDLSFVSDAIANARLGKGAELVVLDGNGRIIARSGDTTQPLPTSTIQRALGTLAEGDASSGGRLTVFRNLVDFQSRRGVPWAIVLTQPEDDAFALARATTRDSLIIGAVVLTLSLLLGAVIADRLTRPLRRLALRADAIAEGHADDGAPVASGPGEIGQLAIRLEEMAQRIGEREALQGALAHEDRLATVGTITAGVAHEINNPLTTILGYSQLLLEDKGDDHADRASLTLISEEAARMKIIVGSLLDYSRSEAPKSGPTDLNAALRRVMMLLSASVKRSRVELQADLAEDLPRAAAGEQALQQIFFNLVQNAAQAMSDGGCVQIISKRASDHLEVDVIDEGTGVPENAREQIFEAFYTTKVMGSGTGLGLAVTRHLVDGFRGRILVGDAPNGRGARFTVVIPIEREHSEHPDHR